MTFNVQGGEDIDGIAAAIRSNDSLREAAVFLLQEIRSYEQEGMGRARRLARALGLSYVYAPSRWMPDGSTQGLAVLGRGRLHDPKVMPLRPFNEPRSVPRTALRVTLDLPDWPQLQLYNVHLDTTINAGERIRQLRPVTEMALEDSAAGVIVGGDFNTNRFSWLFHQVPFPGCGQAWKLDRYMRQAGFDAPTARSGPTVRVPILRLRLDSLYTRGLAADGSGVERSVLVSDHLPVWMDVVPL